MQRTRLASLQRNNKQWRKTLDLYPVQVVHNQYGHDLFVAISLEEYERISPGNEFKPRR